MRPNFACMLHENYGRGGRDISVKKIRFGLRYTFDAIRRPPTMQVRENVFQQNLRPSTYVERLTMTQKVIVKTVFETRCIINRSQEHGERVPDEGYRPVRGIGLP